MNSDAQTSDQDQIRDPETSPATAADTSETSETSAASETSETSAATAQQAPNPARTKARPQTRPRTGPIVWGALILAFCGYVAQLTLAPGNIDATTWIIVTIIGLGILLLGVGATVLIRNRGR